MDGAQIHPPGRQRGAPPLLLLPNAARRAPPRAAGPRLEAPRLVAAAPAQGLEGFRGVPVRDLHRAPPTALPPPGAAPPGAAPASSFGRFACTGERGGRGGAVAPSGRLGPRVSGGRSGCKAVCVI